MLALSTIVVALIAPTLAVSEAGKDKLDSLVTFYGSGGHVVLQLPQGIPSHPTTLAVEVFDFGERSTFGAFDVMIIYNFIASRNAFSPVALITDNPNPDFYDFAKKVVLNSAMWNPTSGMLNVFPVTDNELKIEMHGNVLSANLTIPISITLTAAFGVNFILPPTALQFRGFDNAYKDETLTPMLPSPPLSGYLITMDLQDKPAWVHLWNTQWTGSTAFFEFDGILYQHVTRTYTPPSS